MTRLVLFFVWFGFFATRTKIRLPMALQKQHCSDQSTEQGFQRQPFQRYLHQYWQMPQSLQFAQLQNGQNIPYSFISKSCSKSNLMQKFQVLIKIFIFFVLKTYSDKLYNNLLSCPLVNGFRFENNSLKVSYLL